MPKFFDRRIRGGPILGSAWWTPKWVRNHKIGQQGGPPGGPSFGSVFLFFWNPTAKLFDRRVRGGPIWGSAWRCFWAYDVQAVLGIYGAHSALGAHGALGAFGAHGALGALGALGARGPHGAPSLHSPRFLSVSNPLAFPPQKRTPGEGTFFFTVFWQVNKQNLSDPSRRGQLFLLSFSF